MTERRYTDTEVARIFQRAAEAQQQSSPVPLASREGMTLGALQEIGAEVGLPPDLIAREARALDVLGEPFTRTLLGLPISVGRTVTLPRRLGEPEWERLVVDLRTTFDARGRLQQEGGFRQWTNGNLQALVEPTEQGSRVRMRTLNEMARVWMVMGLGVLGVAAATLLVTVAGNAPLDSGRWGAFLSLGVAGAGLLALGAARLPGWARTRRLQMEEIAARLAAESEKRDQS